MLFVPKKWIIGVGVIVVFAVLNRGDDKTGGDIADALPCVVRVTADVLNVRSAPGTDNPVVGTLGSGQLVRADRTVEAGFRKLSDGVWAADEFLEPTPGSNC